MSESSFSALPAGDLQSEVATDVGRSRKTVACAGVLLAVALGAGGWLLLGGSSDAVAGPGLPPPAPVAAAAEPTPSRSVPVVDREAGRDGRNPFRVLYAPPEAVTAADGAAGGSAAGAAPAPVAGSSAPPVVPPGTAPVTTPVTAPVTAPVAPPTSVLRPLVLIRVQATGESRSAVFTLDGAEQEVAVGDSFGSSGQLLLLSLQEAEAGSWTAVLQLGTGDPFDLVTGQQIHVP